MSGASVECSTSPELVWSGCGLRVAKGLWRVARELGRMRASVRDESCPPPVSRANETEVWHPALVFPPGV